MVLLHLAKHLTRCKNVLCSRPFHQLNLLISLLTSVVNLTYIFFSMLSLRQKFSSLVLGAFLMSTLQSFAYQPSTKYIQWSFNFSLQILEKSKWRNFLLVFYWYFCLFVGLGFFRLYGFGDVLVFGFFVGFFLWGVGKKKVIKTNNFNFFCCLAEGCRFLSLISIEVYSQFLCYTELYHV